MTLRPPPTARTVPWIRYTGDRSQGRGAVRIRSAVTITITTALGASAAATYGAWRTASRPCSLRSVEGRSYLLRAFRSLSPLLMRHGWVAGGLARAFRESPPRSERPRMRPGRPRRRRAERGQARAFDESPPRSLHQSILRSRPRRSTDRPLPLLPASTARIRRLLSPPRPPSGRPRIRPSRPRHGWVARGIARAFHESHPRRKRPRIRPGRPQRLAKRPPPLLPASNSTIRRLFSPRRCLAAAGLAVGVCGPVHSVAYRPR